MKKVYFTGSISSGREDIDTYVQVAEILQKKYTLLNPEVFDKKLDPTSEVVPPSYIFQRDCYWIKECDIFIAEVSRPSHGVGYEIAFAEFSNKPIYLLYRNQSGKILSPMLSGNKKAICFQYDKIDNLIEYLEKTFMK